MQLRIHSSSTGKRLNKEFFNQPTLKVAKKLLGKYLIVNRKGRFQIGRIIETEAYIGPKDKASHASRGKTERNKIMWREPGRLYVYLIYGMYHCLNIVTEKKNFPAAVLIRAIEPVFGISGKTDGPGKLCRELGITQKDTGLDITKNNKIYVKDVNDKPKKILATPRIGVDYAGKWAKKKWRFLAISINQTV
jgi:DNA-3-methyladenine glycosylase